MSNCKVHFCNVSNGGATDRTLVTCAVTCAVDGYRRQTWVHSNTRCKHNGWGYLSL